MKYDLRSIYHALLAFYQKKSIEKVIFQYDQEVNVNGKFKGYDFCPGIVKNFTPPRNCDEKFDDFGMKNRRLIDKQSSKIIAHAIEFYKATIIDYLGENVRVDDIYHFEFHPSKAKKESISGGWHDDNCGHRLKMFICLKGDGRTPTMIAPNSHKSQYKFRLAEFFRFMGDADISPKDGEVALKYFSGDVAIFDTNALHRGYYEENCGERHIILVEFMDRYKSNRISGFAPCGPGSSPSGSVYIDDDALLNLLQTELMDLSLLAKDDATRHSYSISNIQR